MPNHCFNCLTVTGPADKLDAFAKEASGKDLDTGDESPFSLQALYPMPHQLAGTTSGSGEDQEEILQSRNLEEFGARNWYEWRNKNWGTKWDIWDATLGRISPEEALFKFTTAWAPPYSALVVIADRFPELRFKNESTDEFRNFSEIAWFEAECEPTIREMSEVEAEDTFGPIFDEELEEDAPLQIGS